MLREDLREGLRLPPAEFIERIVRQTSYMALLAGDEGGRQRLANLEKLRQLARRETGQGFVNLYDFTERLKLLIEREENEGQEEVDTPENVVRVMTVHAAKGLEFPVVILPRLHKRFQFDPEPYLDQHLGIGFTLPGEDEQDELNPLTALLEEQSRRRTIDEEKRILYVACTRARDMLILSGDWEPDRDKIHCLNWILRGLHIDEKPSGGAIERMTTLERVRLSNGSGERHAEPYIVKVHVLLPEDLPSEDVVAPEEKKAQPAHPRLFIEPLEPGSGGEEFSGEMLRTYIECPHLYFTRHVLGLAGGAYEEKSARFAATLTSLFRQKDLLSVARLVPSDLLNGIVHDFDPTLLLPVAMAIPEGILSDTLPMVYREPGGTWNLVQFQADIGPPGAEEQSKESQHFLLTFGALLLQRSQRVPVVKGTLLNAANPERLISLETSESSAREFESGVRALVRLILEEKFDHRAHPCPVCQAYER